MAQGLITADGARLRSSSSVPLLSRPTATAPSSTVPFV